MNVRGGGEGGEKGVKEGKELIVVSVTPISDLYAYLADFFSFWILHSSVWKAINIHAVVYKAGNLWPVSG